MEKRFRFSYEVEAESMSLAYEIAADNVGCFKCEEVEEEEESSMTDAQERILEQLQDPYGLTRHDKIELLKQVYLHFLVEDGIDGTKFDSFVLDVLDSCDLCFRVFWSLGGKR